MCTFTFEKGRFYCLDLHPWKLTWLLSLGSTSLIFIFMTLLLENVACTSGCCSEFPTYELMIEHKVKCGLYEWIRNINSQCTGFLVIFHQCFKRLSLALHKQGLWLTKTDTQPERTQRWATMSKPELIHTSCRSESSNNSLVVLDKESEENRTLMTKEHFYGDVMKFLLLITKVNSWGCFCDKTW